MEDLAILKQQITLLSVAVHAIAATLNKEQSVIAAATFNRFAQIAQARLETSQIDDATLAAFVDLRTTLESALLPPQEP